MRIGVITFWESNDNYGQQLQCWALQQYLRKMGHEPFLIRTYAWPIPKEKAPIKRIKQLIKNKLIEFLYDTSLAYKPIVYSNSKSLLNKEAVRRRFPQFRREKLKMSRIYYTPSDLVTNPPKADAYITGSDQVWNYWLPQDVYAISFLQFGAKDVRRISYAPSISHNELTEEIKPKIKEYLQSFSAISVREQSSVRLIEGLGFKAERVLDPSMLLKAEAYLELAKYSSGKPNVFIYSMNYASANDIPFEIIQDYAKQRNLPIFVTPGSGYLPAKELFEGVEYSYATIPEWIQHIAHSELVVTASFHGTVFAILFRKAFVYTPLKGEFAETNARVSDLLQDLGLENRIWNGTNSNFQGILSSSINWDLVHQKLNIFRQQSKKYLRDALMETRS